MKKKILTLVMTAMLVVSGVCGMEMSVFAAAPNTSDTNYSFDNRNESSRTTEWRAKNNDSKVYVNPRSGPAVYYTVEGTKSTKAATCSKTFKIGNGIQASITNYVNELGYTKARLLLERAAYAQEWTKGVWSPDSTKNYTIYK